MQKVNVKYNKLSWKWHMYNKNGEAIWEDLPDCFIVNYIFKKLNKKGDNFFMVPRLPQIKKGAKT